MAIFGCLSYEGLDKFVVFLEEAFEKRGAQSDEVKGPVEAEEFGSDQKEKFKAFLRKRRAEPVW